MAVTRRPETIKSGSEFTAWLLTQLRPHDMPPESIRDIAARLDLGTYHQGVTLPYTLNKLHQRGAVEEHTTGQGRVFGGNHRKEVIPLDG